MRGILGRGNQQLIPTIKTHKMKKDEMLVARLDFLIPMNFFLSQEWQLMFGVDSKIAIGRVVELNPKWVIEVVNNLEHRLTDVLHDFRGIYADDEHFLPRIQAEEFNCEMCSKSMDEKEHDFSDICDDCREQDDSEDILGDFDENGDAVDVKVYGYTNMQTYRLCGWLDQITNYHNKGLFDYFFDLVRDGEFEESDYEVIDWNEVVKRYSNEQRSYYLGSITRS